MKNRDKNISGLVNRFIKESFVDITNKTDDEAFEEIAETLHGNQKKIDVAKPKGKITGADFKKLRAQKDKEKPKSPAGFEYGEIVAEEGETEEGNAFSGALNKARAAGKDEFEVDGNKYPVKESVFVKMQKMVEKRRKRINESKKNQKKNTIMFNESELINFIERIVEAETKEDKETMKSLKSSKSVNDKAISDSNKKMKDYMKNMGIQYDSDSKNFPKGNSVMSRQGKDGKEITDDTKKAYKASKEIEEYIENFTAAGLENLDYDNIKPNEDWVTDNIEGSSRTGNSPKYANAVETDVNKKVNDRRKKNLLAVLKRQAYNKAPQPVHTDEAGEVIPGTGEGVPSSKSGKKNSEVNKIMASESVENKKVLTDIKLMKNLMNYNQKTQ